MIDGNVFIWQRHGGVSRIYKEVLPLLANINNATYVTVLLPYGVANPFGNKEICVERYLQLKRNLRPWRLWHHVTPLLNKCLYGLCFVKRKSDVFHSTYYSVLPHAKPSVCFVHDLIVELYPQHFDDEFVKLESARKQLAILQSNVIICNSFSTKNDLEKLYDVSSKHCYVAHLAGFGTVHDDLKVVHSVEGMHYLLYVGDCTLSYKNFGFFLDSLAAFSDDFMQDLNVVIVTSRKPPSRLIDSFVNRFGADKLVVLLNCSDSELRWLYANCLAYVYPSLCEGFGIPLVEAMQCGAPVMCSDIPVFREVMGDVAYYFDPNSKSEFHAALCDVIFEVHSGEIKAVERERQLLKYSWTKTAKVFYTAFCDAVNL